MKNNEKFLQSRETRKEPLEHFGLLVFCLRCLCLTHTQWAIRDFIDWNEYPCCGFWTFVMYSCFIGVGCGNRSSFSVTILWPGFWKASKCTVPAKYTLMPVGYWNRNSFIQMRLRISGKRRWFPFDATWDSNYADFCSRGWWEFYFGEVLVLIASWIQGVLFEPVDGL